MRFCLERTASLDKTGRKHGGTENITSSPAQREVKLFAPVFTTSKSGEHVDCCSKVRFSRYINNKNKVFPKLEKYKFSHMLGESFDYICYDVSSVSQIFSLPSILDNISFYCPD